MNDTRVDVGGFLMGIRQSAVTGSFMHAFDKSAPQIDYAAAVAADQAISPDELSWLKARIDADGTLDPFEKALIAFVSAESGQAIPLWEPSAGAPVVPAADIGHAPVSPGIVIGPLSGGGSNS